MFYSLFYVGCRAIMTAFDPTVSVVSVGLQCWPVCLGPTQVTLSTLRTKKTVRLVHVVIIKQNFTC